MNRDEKLKFVKSWFYAGTSFEAWFQTVEQQVKPHMKVCEIGSGSGQGFQNKQYPKAKFIFGMDLDPRVLQNPFLNRAAVGSAYDLEKLVESKKFDVIYSHMVVEHIYNPRKFIEAQVNCLKPDGIIIHSTVSRYYWSSLVNNLVPDRIKNWLIQRLGSGRTSEDTFDAYYKLNSATQVAELAKTLNLDYSISRSDQAPGYLRVSIVLMLIYTTIHKPLQAIFPALRPTLIYSFKKIAN
jgi:SAM-dependent methyltransferase